MSPSRSAVGPIVSMARRWGLDSSRVGPHLVNTSTSPHRLASAPIGQGPLVVGDAANVSLHRFGMTHHDEHGGIVADGWAFDQQNQPFFSACGAATLVVVRRVAVIGCIGAGKSTLARNCLGERLTLPVIHLDRLWWDDSDYRITGAATVAAHTMPGDEFRRLQCDSPPATPGSSMAATCLISTPACREPTRSCSSTSRDGLASWRLVRRHDRRRPDYPNGVREGLGWFALLARWIWRYPREKRPVIVAAISEHCGPTTAVVRLRRRNDVDDFLASVAPPS